MRPLSPAFDRDGDGMPATVKGPAIFLAQFASDTTPFNSFEAICGWAAGLGYKGVQIPTWDARLFNLERLHRRRPIATRLKVWLLNTALRSPNCQRIFRANSSPCIPPMTRHSTGSPLLM